MNDAECEAISRLLKDCRKAQLAQQAALTVIFEADPKLRAAGIANMQKLSDLLTGLPLPDSDLQDVERLYHQMVWPMRG
jgi:hypothetical protein